jgi:hypothetical protein
MSEHRKNWITDGAFRIPDVISTAQWEEITREAWDAEPSAFPRVNEHLGLVLHRDGTITSPQRCRAHEAGRALRDLALSPVLISVVSEALGAEALLPARFGFKYYTAGDFMAVHRDDVKCSVTISFGITENMREMGWLPKMRQLSSQEVADELNGQGMFPGQGEQVTIGYRSLLAFDGYNIPHWRPPFEDTIGILGTICYFKV